MSRTFAILRTAIVVALSIVLALLAPAVEAASSMIRPAADPNAFLIDAENLEYDPGWYLRTGILASDNIQRVPSDGDEEVVGVGEFGANWRKIGSRFAAAFDGSIAYRHYTQNTFDDEARGNFLAAGSWFMIPRTLDWFAMNRLANAPIDPLATTSPTNVQFVNVFETGPRLTLRPGNSNELTATLSRADVRAEESDIDHLRDTATVGFMHGFSANHSLGAVASARTVDFEADAQATDFDQGQAYLNYELRRDTVKFNAAAGQARIEMANGLEGDTGVGWLRLAAQRTSDSFLYLALEREASDTAATMLRDELLLEQGGVSSVIVTGDPYFADRASARYTRGWRAHEWFVAAFGRDLDYFVSALDQRQVGAQIGGQLVLSPRLAVDIAATSYDIEYRVSGREDTVHALRTEADYRIDRAWSLMGGLRFLERDSTEPEYRFDEIMLTLFISYSPGRQEPIGGEL